MTTNAPVSGDELVCVFLAAIVVGILLPCMDYVKHYIQRFVYGESCFDIEDARKERERVEEEEIQKQNKRAEEEKEKAIKEDYTNTISKWEALCAKNPDLTAVLTAFFKLQSHPGKRLVDIENPLFK